MTSLSLDDLRTQGDLIGFYPDNAKAVSFKSTADQFGIGEANNHITLAQNAFNILNSYDNGNDGLYKRFQAWNYDPAGLTAVSRDTFGSLLGFAPSTTNSNGRLNTLWKSYIFNKTNATVAPAAGAWQAAITAVVYLKHLHSFFERVPLLKGVFMRMTLNLNQSSVSFTSSATGVLDNLSVNSPLGGVSPLMISSFGSGGLSLVEGSYTASVAVGARVLNTTQAALTGIVQSSPLGQSVLLNVPAYTFNPVFEASYLSSPVKKIVYEDIYQYQLINQIAEGGTFNNLITNGIANIKSVLCLPFFSAAANGGVLPIQSPWDAAGGGATSALCLLSQFNIQVSGQNAIYNTERYAYEQFANQLKGYNSVNGGMTDGLCSGLVGQADFELEYCYYYVNVGRMLPVEEAVPKSVNVLGTNMSSKPIDLFVFISYGVEVSVDILTGARV